MTPKKFRRHKREPSLRNFVLLRNCMLQNRNFLKQLRDHPKSNIVKNAQVEQLSLLYTIVRSTLNGTIPIRSKYLDTLKRSKKIPFIVNFFSRPPHSVRMHEKRQLLTSIVSVLPLFLHSILYKNG